MVEETSPCLNKLTGVVIDAAIEVHKTLGPGYVESVYEEALAFELGLRNVRIERQKSIAVNYKGHAVGQGRLDVLVESELIVELKAVENIASIHKAQVLSYLKSTGLKVALLINFNSTLLKDGIKRIIRS